MDRHQSSDFLIPGFELMPLTSDYDQDNDGIDSTSNNVDGSEPLVDWIDDCQVQENLFQIIPLTPEETRCDKNNHIIQADVKVFFEELGYICDEPEPIDSGRDYEAEYKQQQQRHCGSKNIRRQRQRRQCHVDLETMPTPSPAAHRHGTLDTVSSPGLSSTSSSFYHTDDDEDNIKSSIPHTNRLPHLNHHHGFLYHQHHHHHHHPHHPLSKSTVTPSHFSFMSIRN